MTDVLDIVEEGEDCLEEEVCEDSLLLEASRSWLGRLKDEAIEKVRSEIKGLTDPSKIADIASGAIKSKAKKLGKQMYTGKKRS